MVPRFLKNWEFVKDKPHNLTNFKPGNCDSPELYYYQFDGYQYTPVFFKSDVDTIPK